MHLFKLGAEVRHRHLLAGVATNGAGVVNFGTAKSDRFTACEKWLRGLYDL